MIKQIFVTFLSFFVVNGASAGIIQVGGDAGGPNGKKTAETGVCTITFDGSACAGVTASGMTANDIVIGSSSNRYAAPMGDTSHYLAVGPFASSSVSFSMPMAANYFGFFTGSLDSFNLVQFFLGGILVDSFSGTQINAVAFPGQATTGNQTEAQFIDYFPTSFYDSVVISATSNAFELDNLAIGLATPASVPEPSMLALIGLSGLALIGAQRRKRRS